MSKINNVLELNGQRYDSQTGAPIGVINASAAHRNTTHSPQGRRVRSLDGFMPAPAPKPAKQDVDVIPLASQPSRSDVERAARRSVKAVNPHSPERSKTLMRHTVKAPKVRPNRVEHVQAPTDVAKVQPKVMGIKPKLSSEVIDSDRAQRATNVRRSNQVVRFKRQKVLVGAVTAAPAAQIALPTAIEQAAPEAAPSLIPKKDAFERAIDNASSHEQPAVDEGTKRKARRGVRKHARWVSITAIVLAAVLLGGFIAYQNKIELQLQLASAKAGFPATMPGFHPVGYSAKSLNYGPGKVAIGYSGPNNQSYKVVQKSSNWDSQTLLENFVATSGQPYDAYKASGRTVYVYGNGNATWVSGGVWYQVNDNGSLSKDQIIQLANSM